ncbi:MAG: hypothetical protein Q4C84_13990 [Bacillota bacterium]|nr:hypothetical protein [Bacillota bacterium]
MSEKAKKIIVTIVVLAVFIVSLALIVIGQRHIGPKGLMMMLVGLVGLIILLGLYNRQYK